MRSSGARTSSARTRFTRITLSVAGNDGAAHRCELERLDEPLLPGASAVFGAGRCVDASEHEQDRGDVGIVEEVGGDGKHVAPGAMGIEDPNIDPVLHARAGHRRGAERLDGEAEIFRVDEVEDASAEQRAGFVVEQLLGGRVRPGEMGPGVDEDHRLAAALEDRSGARRAFRARVRTRGGSR